MILFHFYTIASAIALAVQSTGFGRIAVHIALHGLAR
jgi:hypothetical protein